MKYTIPEEELMDYGNLSCQGCGGALAMRYTLKALGKNTIVIVPACCWTIIAGHYPHSCLKVPLLHTAFETTASVASGVRAALKMKNKNATVVGWAGDGGTFDIGIQALSGAAERNEDFIYICYDNEAYMNTGIQRSSSTPYGAWTTTTPGKRFKSRPKKDMVSIMVAHNIPYTATANIAYPEDLIRKLKKAKSISGTKYIQILAPCPTGWRMDPSKTIEIARLAVFTGIYPIYEVENGRYRINMKVKNKPVNDYIKMQGRFRYLTDKMIEEIQKNVDKEWNILLRKEKFTNEVYD